ncbi:hypothetical protein B7494_g4192 [Chlorociboria aeruginascens]|nr:hypothetical protein B7494_g4192 [Chlorociboria aeruginascens]
MAAATVTVSVHPAETNSGTITSWIPLATAYPIVPSCTTAFYAPGALDIGVLYLFDPNNHNALFPTHCLPPEMTSWWNQNNTNTITSIGGPFLCPLAYSPVYSETSGTSSFTACCPSGYSYATSSSQGAPGECTSIMNSGATLTFVEVDSAITSIPTYSTETATLSSSLTVTGVQINGYNFEVPTSSTSSSTASISASQTTTSIPAAAADSGLSSGAIAGIAIGAAVLGLGACAAAVVFFIKAHKANKRSQQAIGFEATMPAWRRNYDGESYSGPSHEMEGSIMQDLYDPSVKKSQVTSTHSPLRKSPFSTEPQEMDAGPIR